MLTHQGDEAAGIAERDQDFVALLAHKLHLLLEAAAYGHHQPAAIGQLRDESFGDAGRGGGYQNLVEGGVLGQAERAIALNHANIRIAQAL